MKKISLLGATGSVGTQTLAILREHPDQFALVAMAFGENIQTALPLIHEFKPALIAVKNKQVADRLKIHLDPSTRLVYGIEGMIEAAVHPDSDLLVNAVLGSIGLEPTLAAIEAGKTIGLANKETLVTAGHLVMRRAKKFGVPILPVDSEHSAIFQSMQGQDRSAVSRIIITASGGSFRDKTREELAGVTVKDALNHPNWSMGAKITIDSATMMNKGLEIIEAHWLFDLPYEKIDTVIHRESIVHSLVEYADHSVIAQLGCPSMLVPIQYALTYPSRLTLRQTKTLNLSEIGSLHFQKMDMHRFPCVSLAYHAGKTGGSMPTVLNAANETAVQAFLAGKITFLDIERYVEMALTNHHVIKAPELKTIEAVDKETRAFVKEQIN
ncbi:1-deoxy-D-xylulose-5-phosphate reductoisomerase [Sporolactobacillus terrae]|uniref:1-deoxy-D-xylulose 5-phosphate reductoisomerase n=1 Tax=Sporolactobacillus terrae TaxID=269673 RepID=A0ABX5Q6W5_9BACL|nr:1-deoxy-D-xylulose-5-phosphate reductoisomerase [Sporolactobacillus terrae]QAA22373.1 1-deoxy-D-xylulose-5-phosphate reductoisomerase [Sporolactobacillus terrae]QAA25349.1 1-deoxy-D-xylulose-5-phosphate reductoisomerase [Sporolactobacillus terrae]UAK17158.1 1-deoxy-D-xylulose-5-phosphate reductoisomerase [Sporolactobacillus terrae]